MLAWLNVIETNSQERRCAAFILHYRYCVKQPLCSGCLQTGVGDLFPAWREKHGAAGA